MSGTKVEWRGTVTCSDDPCTYCRAPAQTRVLVKPSQPEFATEDEALAHARGMAHNVYGGSTHSVGTVSREVTAWR